MVKRDVYLLQQSEQFYLKPGHEAAVDMTLNKAPPFPCTRLIGQVKSVGGPISGATVKILDKEFKPLFHDVTDSKGNFSFIHTLVPGIYQIVGVGDGYLISESRRISMLPSTSVYVTIWLHPDKDAGLGTLYGMTRDGENDPLPGVRVCVFDNEEAEYPRAVTQSNTDGEYMFYGLAPSKYVVKAFLRDFVLPYSIPVNIFPKEILCADLYLYQNTLAYKGTISGVVTHNDIEVPNAVAALYQVKDNKYTLIRIQKANNKGFYLFSGCDPGTYVVKAKLEKEHKTLCYAFQVD